MCDSADIKGVPGEAITVFGKKKPKKNNSAARELGFYRAWKKMMNHVSKSIELKE
jgi:hypothetical protein